MTTFSIEPVKPHIGGVVHVDKKHLCDDDVVRAVREALEDRGVLVFPRMHLCDEEQLAFTDRLGRRVDFTRRVPGSQGAAPDVYRITLDEEFNTDPDYVLGTYFWHIDGVTVDQPLPKATLLSARRLSATGGQTEFANTYAAYENLPDEERAALEGLEAVHSVAASLRPLYDELAGEGPARWKGGVPTQVRPIVWTHESGRRSLVIGTHADRVVGMPLAHGRSLLVRLSEWAAQPAFSYRHEWQEGDLVVWDNCGVMHRVVPYDAKSGRTMHRTTIAGEERVG